VDTYSSHREVEKPKTQKGRHALLRVEVDALTERIEKIIKFTEGALGRHTTQHVPLIDCTRRAADLLKRLRAELK